MWSKMTFLAFISSKCKHFGLIILILKKTEFDFCKFQENCGSAERQKLIPNYQKNRRNAGANPKKMF